MQKQNGFTLGITDFFYIEFMNFRNRQAKGTIRLNLWIKFAIIWHIEINSMLELLRTKSFFVQNRDFTPGPLHGISLGCKRFPCGGPVSDAFLKKLNPEQLSAVTH